jgi:hypothetical protein
MDSLEKLRFQWELCTVSGLGYSLGGAHNWTGGSLENRVNQKHCFAEDRCCFSEQTPLTEELFSSGVQV